MNKILKISTVVVYLIGASTGYVHQMFNCKTPQILSNQLGYDCLSRDIAFYHELIGGSSITMMALLFFISKPKGWFKGFQIGMMGFTVGGMIDFLLDIENNLWTIFGFVFFLLATLYEGRKK